MGRFSTRLKKLLGSKKEDAAGLSTTQYIEHKRSSSPSLPPVASQPTQPQQVKSRASQINVVKEEEVPAEETAQDKDEEEQDEGHDLWAEAFRQLERREPELAADYLKHISTFQGSDGSGSSSGSGRIVLPVRVDVHSAEPVIGQLLANREERQWRIPLLDKDIKIRAQVERLAKFCLFTNEIVKQALSSQPCAALAWSGVSILLPLINSGKIQHASMLDGFEYIGEVQLYWKFYEQGPHPQAQPHQKDIRQALIKLYSQVLEYQAKVICHLSTAQLSRAWEKVSGSSDWDGQKQTIANMDKHCHRLLCESDRVKIQEQRDVQLREIQESREILSEIRKAIQSSDAKAEVRHRNDVESALLRDLSSDYEHFKNVHPKRVNGTCEWLFHDDCFRKWRARESSSLLWVSASPGCGKSVLARSLIDENRLSDNAATTMVCYFFFQTGVDGQMDSASALSALIHQLLVQDPTGQMFPKGLESYKKHGDKLGHNFAELWRLLVACAHSYPSGEIIVVLDALDECGEKSRETLLQALDSFFTVSAQNTRLKFLVTSRPYDDLESAFERHTNRTTYLRVDGDEKAAEIEQEINIVIDTKIEEFARDFSEAHRKALADRLKTMENRTYLWLYLTFDIIKNRRARFSKASQIHELLDSIPRDVSDAYEVILEHVSDDLDDRALTQSLLELVLAATRPLTLDEANYALTLTTAGHEFSSQEEIDDQLWPKGGFKSVVRNLSGLFIIVCDSRLSLIHLTAREFLTDRKKKGQWHGCLTMEGSHSTMASTCVDYLAAIDPGTLEGNMASLAGGFPFLAYSLTNWSLHYNSQLQEGQQKLSKKARGLCEMSHGRGDRLVQFYCESSTLYWVMDEPSERTELNMACALGLMPVIKEIVDEVKNQPEFAELYPVALDSAARQGHANVVDFLTRNTSSAEAHGLGNSIVLTMALSYFFLGEARQYRLIKTLLDNTRGLHIMDEDSIGIAMNTGGKALVSLLLERLGDEIQFTETFLTQAISNADHGAEVVEWLLDHKPESVHTSEDILIQAASNYRSAAQVFAVLLRRRGQDVQITERILISAAKNRECGKDLLGLLLKERGDSIEITEKVMTAAADNHGSAPDIFEVLLGGGGGRGTIEITGSVVDAVMDNRKFACQLLKLLRDQGHEIPITALTLGLAVANAGCGFQLTMELMEMPNRNSEALVTATVIEKAAANDVQGFEIIEYLLKRSTTSHHGVSVTARAVECASKNASSGREILELPLDHLGHGLQISPEALEQSASNRGQGLQIMSLLLDTAACRETPITITAVINAAQNPKFGKEMIELLLEKRAREVQVTGEVLSAASRSTKNSEAIRSLLLEHKGSTE